MRFQLSESDFESTFGLRGATFYAKFIDKLNNELNGIVHPSAKVEGLTLNSKWTDAGGNLHARLVGIIVFLEQRGELGGEFVWLRNLKKFRGKAWSSLELPTDTQLLLKARQSVRREQYAEARSFLNAIQNRNSVPRSAVFLEQLVAQKLK